MCIWEEGENGEVVGDLILGCLGKMKNCVVVTNRL